MSKTIKIILSLLLLFILCSSACLATSVTPQTTENNVTDGENATVQENTDTATTQENSSAVSILNTDIYAFEDSKTIEKSVNGNVFVYANSVIINADINGDLFVFASTLTIEEGVTISGNIFSCASTFTLKGTARDVYFLGQNLILENNSTIQRDLKAYVSEATINGTIQKDVYITANKISIPEDIPNVIQGDLHYSATEEMSFPEGSINGEVVFSKITTPTLTTSEIVVAYLKRFINVAIYALAIILLVTFFAPKFKDKLTYCMNHRPFISAGIGVVALFIIPFLAILLAISGYISYLGIALLAVYLFILSITISILGIAIGNYFVKKFKEQTKVKSILLSIAAVTVIWLLQLIPTLGGYISLFTVVFGLGLFLVSFFTRKDVSELESKASKK